MTKKTHRIKEVGATINLGNYSSLHVTVGEASEFAGLEFGRAVDYLKNIASEVDGVLNLPEKLKSKKKVAEKSEEPKGEKIYSFAGGPTIWYDHESHTYTSETGVPYVSVTQLLESFYPFEAADKISKEYMDFAASYGNLVHTAIQNAVIGKPPKKQMVAGVIEDVLKAMGPFNQRFVEQLIALPEQEVAGRFDILTKDEGKATLWDVKTNSSLYMETKCTLPDVLKEKYSKSWGVDTIYGEHCFQLNLYAYIIEKTTDWVIDEIKIIHVPDNFEGIIDVPKVDVSDILSYYGSIR